MSTAPVKTPQRSTTVHVKISGEMLERLDKMTAADRRDRAEFMRLLVEDEWNRRQSIAKGNGAQP
jgi:predicted transcriptional regulator